MSATPISPPLFPSQRNNLTIQIPLPIADLSPTDVRIDSVVSHTFSQLKKGVPASPIRTYPNSLSPFEEDPFDHEKTFVKKSSLSTFDNLPTKKEFDREVHDLWDSSGEGNVVVCFRRGAEKYYFKFKKDLDEEVETIDFEILKADNEVAEEILETDYIHFITIEEALKSLAPIFTEEGENFAEHLQFHLRRIAKNCFIGDAEYTIFAHHLSEEDFAHEMQELSKDRNTKFKNIAISFMKESYEYIFNFEDNGDGTVDFDFFRNAERTIPIESLEECIKFTNIAEAITVLKSAFRDKEASEAAFFEQLKEIVQNKEEMQFRTLFTVSDTEQRRIMQELLSRIEVGSLLDCNSVLDYDVMLAHMQSMVKSQDPVALEQAFTNLQQMMHIAPLQIGDELQFMPIAGLVLYYLQIIQVNKTPSTLTNDSGYAAKAFQNTEGCTSTGDERSKACLYARADILLYALEISLNTQNNQAEKCIACIRKVGAEMPSTQLQNFQLNFTQSKSDQLRAVEQARKVMKDALDLP